MNFVYDKIISYKDITNKIDINELILQKKCLIKYTKKNKKMIVKILICGKFLENNYRNKSTNNDNFYFNLNLKNYLNNK